MTPKSMKFVLLAVAGLVASMALAACGGGGISGGSSTEDIPTAQGGTASGKLKISNWPLYIDKKTIGNFEEETGISVDYVQDVNDNDEFFGKIQPLVSQGKSGDRDIIVVSDWMASKMYKLGYIQNLDPDELDTARNNMLPSLKNPTFDPGREFSVPWQSGMTGLVVRSDLAPDIKSISDLFDPQYKGKVTMLREMRDTIPLILMDEGIDPATASTEQWLEAIDKVKGAVDSGQIRAFTGNDYIQNLAKGSVVAAIGWSGDAVQAQLDNPNIEYVQPTGGCALWSDNMLIPVGAPNPAAAYEFMNYVYRPEIQAPITAWVNYISPVSGVSELLTKEDPELASNELIFPSDEYTENCSTQDSPPGDPAQVKEVEEAFQDVLTG
ncbi:MAG: spermidine/putrescine ABC transporter substrate-binding protein [Solirubrobacterales bacterium]